MILIEAAGHRVTIHNGKVKADGPMAGQMAKIARAAVKRAGCRPEHGEPDMHAAMILIAEWGGRVLEHQTTNVPGRIY
jgi:hypothetical protein